MFPSEMLKDLGVARDKRMQALQQVAVRARTTKSEGKYQALENMGAT